MENVLGTRCHARHLHYCHEQQPLPCLRPTSTLNSSFIPGPHTALPFVSSYVPSTVLSSGSGTRIHLNVAMPLHMCLRPSSPPPLGHPSTSMWPCLFICAFDHPHLRLWDTHPPQCDHVHLSRNCVVCLCKVDWLILTFIQIIGNSTYKTKTSLAILHMRMCTV